MTKLYTYCIPIDDGAAPNPFWGKCTLTICKPRIRSVAMKGDWIVGTGSKNSPIGDISTSVVYAMRVSEVMPMRKYDQYCRQNLTEKIPDWQSPDLKRRMGDCIYDFSTTPPTVRLGVHSIKNRDHDLGGIHALLSDHFYYFGDKPIPLPPNLHPIIKAGQAHKSASNSQHVSSFVAWIGGLGYAPCSINGEPQVQFELGSKPGCSSCRDEEEDDEKEKSKS
jgi:hypothetical protein